MRFLKAVDAAPLAVYKKWVYKSRLKRNVQGSTEGVTLLTKNNSTGKVGMSGMRRRIGVLGAAVCLLTAAAAAFGAEHRWDPAKFMGVENLRRGMKGHILTVVEDTKIEELPFEILSVEINNFPKGDLIWAVGSNEKFIHMGTVGGMSGSPAIVDGKIIGALAYGYTNSKDPLIGITPIKQMLAVWDRNMVPAPPGRRSGGIGLLPDLRSWTEAADRADAAENAAPGMHENAYQDAYEMPEEALKGAPQYDYLRGQTMRRLDIPVSAGFTRTMLPFIEEMFARRGMTVVQGAGTGAAAANIPKPAVEAGCIIGTEYLRGDYKLFGYGTLTYREGDKILAYGHPRNGEGDTYIPLSTGTVHFVVPSRVRSSKIASGIEVVGTMTQDREPAIAGVIGEHPAYIPMRVAVKSGDSEPEVYNYELLDDPFMTGSIARTAAGVSMDTTEKSLGKFALSADLTVQFRPDTGLDPLRKRNDFTGDLSPGFAAASMMSPITPILNNWYEEVGIERIDLEIEYRDRRESAVIQKARIGKRRVRPGDSIELAITYRPFLEDPVVKRYKVQIPENAPDGFAFVFIGDPASHDRWERQRAVERYQAGSVKQLVENLSRGGSQRGVMISVASGRMGLAVDGGELPNLPNTMLGVMDTAQHRGGAGLTTGSLILEERLETPFLADGSALLTFMIDSKAP